MKKMQFPTIEQIHEQFCKDNNHKYNPKHIKKDLEWQCFAVATTLAKMLKSKKVKARAVYGTWEGFSVSNRKKGFNRHGWVLIDEKFIVDPTLWVFSDGTPELAVKGEVSKNPQYDEAMVKLRSLISRPYPEFNANDRPTKFEWSEKTALLIEKMSGSKKQEEFSVGQVLWMANIDYSIWGDSLNEVYSVLVQKGFEAFIPMDFRSKWKALFPEVKNG